jgi:hypothetical protein
MLLSTTIYSSIERERAYLNTTVMKDVPEPRESSVLVALVEEPDLFFDNVFSLRACILVKVHYKTWVFLTVCKSKPERHS